MILLRCLGSMSPDHPTAPRCIGSIYAWFHCSRTIDHFSPCVERRRNRSRNWRWSWNNSLRILVEAM
jgi:hypothetical protein